MRLFVGIKTNTNFCCCFPESLKLSLLFWVAIYHSSFPPLSSILSLFFSPSFASSYIKVKQCRSPNVLTVMSLPKVTTQRFGVPKNMFISQCQRRPHQTFPQILIMMPFSLAHLFISFCFTLLPTEERGHIPCVSKLFT